MKASVPFVSVPERVGQQLADLGAPPEAAGSRLYQALANQPELLSGWVEFAWRLRQRCATPGRLRELMITRGVQMVGCDIELESHQARARSLGVGEDELGQVDQWRRSTLFTSAERAALALMEEMVAGSISNTTSEELARQFNPSERVELILTAGMYVMVPRVLDALRLTQRPT